MRLSVHTQTEFSCFARYYDSTTQQVLGMSIRNWCGDYPVLTIQGMYSNYSPDIQNILKHDVAPAPCSLSLMNTLQLASVENGTMSRREVSEMTGIHMPMVVLPSLLSEYFWSPCTHQFHPQASI